CGPIFRVSNSVLSFSVSEVIVGFSGVPMSQRLCIYYPFLLNFIYGSSLLSFVNEILTGLELTIFKVHFAVRKHFHSVIHIWIYIILTKRESDPIIRTKNTTRIRVVIKSYTHHIELFSFLEIGRRINRNDRI